MDLTKAIEAFTLTYSRTTLWPPTTKGTPVPIPASGQTLNDPAATIDPFLVYRAVSVP